MTNYQTITEELISDPKNLKYEIFCARITYEIPVIREPYRISSVMYSFNILMQ